MISSTMSRRIRVVVKLYLFGKLIDSRLMKGSDASAFVGMVNYTSKFVSSN